MLRYTAVCLVFLTCVHSSVPGELNSSNNVWCQPHKSVVPVEKNGLPYYVELHRCQGSAYGLNPKLKKCVESETDDVTVKVSDAVGGTEIIKMKNHTGCTEECDWTESCTNEDLFQRNEQDCSCSCKYDQAPNGCPKDTEWDSEECRCKCRLTEEGAKKYRGKILDQEKCKYVCAAKCKENEFMDERRCRCRSRPAAVGRGEGSDGSIQGKVIVALVIGEFVVLYLIFDFLLCSKKTGLMYYMYTKCKCSRTPQQQPEGETETKKCLGTGDEANHAPVAVRVESNGNSKVVQPAQAGPMYMSST